MKYPDGDDVGYNYSSGLNDLISPLSDTTKKSSGTNYLRSILSCRQTLGNPLPINS